MGLIALTRTGMEGLFDRLRAAHSGSSRGWRRAQNGSSRCRWRSRSRSSLPRDYLGRSFWNLRNARIGFEPANAMTFQVSLPWGPSGYPSYAAQAEFHAKLMDRLAALPGVTSVGGALHLPLAGRERWDTICSSGPAMMKSRPPVPRRATWRAATTSVRLGIPLRAGRTFQAGDLRGTPAVIVSERLAMSIFGTTDVVGRSIVRPPSASPARQSTAFRIVGVVGDIQRGRIEDGYTPMAYFPLLRDGDGLPADSAAAPYAPKRCNT